MSDGNFNRSLLPAGGYAAGVRAGETRMKIRALASFRKWFAEARPDATSAEAETALQAFRAALEHL